MRNTTRTLTEVRQSLDSIDIDTLTAKAGTAALELGTSGYTAVTFGTYGVIRIAAYPNGIAAVAYHRTHTNTVVAEVQSGGHDLHDTHEAFVGLLEHADEYLEDRGYSSADYQDPGEVARY